MLAMAVLETISVRQLMNRQMMNKVANLGSDSKTPSCSPMNLESPDTRAASAQDTPPPG